MRDIADLHLRAMLRPEAKEEHFLAVAGASISMIDVATVLRARFGSAARRVPRRQMPDWVVCVVAIVRPEIKLILPLSGKMHDVSTKKARIALVWQPRSTEEAIAATAESLLQLGPLEKKPGIPALITSRMPFISDNLGIYLQIRKRCRCQLCCSSVPLWHLRPT